MDEIVTDAPAPWRLTGRGYISVLRYPAPGIANADAFVPTALQADRVPGRLAYLMFVDYDSSPVGPYHELLFIPGAFRFGAAKHLSISRIFVSSMDSVVNGQRNWGIPKDVADFQVRYNQQGVDQVVLSRQGQVFAELDFRRWPLPIPVWGHLVPEWMRTLGQRHAGQTFTYAPVSHGFITPARLQRAKVDPSVFPDVSAAKVLATVGVSRFWMTFPEARIVADAD